MRFVISLIAPRCLFLLNTAEGNGNVRESNAQSFLMMREDQL